MFPLVFALCVICFVKSSVSSLSDYYQGQNSLDASSASQAYKHGDSDSLAQVISFPGKQSRNRPAFASSYTGMSHGSGNNYGGNYVPDRQREIYSFTPAHSGHLDLTEHTESDQVKSFHASKSLSGYNAPTNNYIAEDNSLPSPAGVHHDVYSHSTGLPSASLDLTKHTAGLRPLQPLYHRLHFLSGHSGYSNDHGAPGTLSLGYGSFGRPHDVRGNYNKHAPHWPVAGTQTAHNVGSSHASVPSSAYLNHNDGDHSYFHSLAEALARGWSALLND